MPIDKGHPEAGFIEMEPLVIAGTDLVFLIVALASFIILAAGWVFGWLLQELLGGVSILGFHPFGFLGGLLQGAVQKISGALWKRVIHLAHFLWSLGVSFWRGLYVVAAMFQYSFLWTFHHLNSLWASILGQQAYTDVQVRGANAYTNQQINQLYQEMQGEDIQLQQSISQLQAGTNTFAESLFQGALTADDNTLAQANAHADANLSAAEQYTRDQIAQIQTNPSFDVNSINQRINSLQLQLQNQAAADLTTAESFATGAIAGAAPGIVAQAVAALQPTLGKIETDITECLDPLCDTVTPNANQLGDLGKLLKALEALFGAAALTGLLVAAVEDPKRAADDVVNVAGWMSTLGLDMVNAVGEAAGVQL